MTSKTFSDFGLAEPILRAVTACGYTTPTPIQAQAIPGLMDGRDMLGIAQTGTGKTAAFALPIIDRLLRDVPPANDTEKRSGKGPRNKPRALILAPTRELAIQIGTDVKTYCKDTRLRHSVIFGGVKEGPQITALARGTDIVIATPGRLLDLVRQRKADLRRVDSFVLDEADRMLDMGFIRDIRALVDELPKDRQSLLFSATMPREIAKLAESLLQNPLRVEIAPQSTPIERIEQSVYHLPTADKMAKLVTLLEDEAVAKAIVFTRTKHRANRVSEQLEKRGIDSAALHGNKSQGARQRALKAFRNGEMRVLVATDIAARGIDIDDISHVVNFELPNEAESYVHRIGRTARAGKSGVAVSLCDPTEQGYLRDIERQTGVRLTVIGDAPAPAEPPPTRTRRGNRPPAKLKTDAPANKRRRPRRRRRAA
ncbi:MAG: DEAD/DEAH box helicase [Pseudomonadota bacterium]